ncbi:hypothetical protein ACFY19_14115 [Streptosporangium saharense]|uniref:Uncharacterized protein n=1 Tax=Streptosporangium saharense TaxID=1706840 RepID=A0A7W7QW76_9ACTN|nr:hypothetical protein [Streptosporangium saharense]MBB4920916.1 hypothetical protein [Streptosporangium saharense]
MIRRLLTGLALAGAAVALPLAAAAPASAAADPAPIQIITPSATDDPTPDAGEAIIQWISPGRCRAGGGWPVRVVPQWGYCRGGAFHGWIVRFY